MPSPPLHTFSFYFAIILRHTCERGGELHPLHTAEKEEEEEEGKYPAAAEDNCSRKRGITG